MAKKPTRRDTPEAVCYCRKTAVPSTRHGIPKAAFLKFLHNMQNNTGLEELRWNKCASVALQKVGEDYVKEVLRKLSLIAAVDGRITVTVRDVYSYEYAIYCVIPCLKYRISPDE
ncbi:unnamed protein product [Cylicocyclus nassatus]|uniref:Core Histone H2A/H2B/H3 domain-containing protein n=1 Tax=Cylicocyclus nassatus TaxID=53992 RepID=A0AA36M8S5_CYLNA|nr:unnamed protein product [Cylicocyclus nassatus]